MISAEVRSAARTGRVRPFAGVDECGRMSHHLGP